MLALAFVACGEKQDAKTQTKVAADKPFVVAIPTYPGFAIINKVKITGTEHFKDLPKRNVLFVSNHQTYFADVITFLHIFCAVKWRKKNRLGIPYYLLNPFTSVYYVAAEETMKGSWISRFFTLAGALTVKRTWRVEGKEIRRGLDPSDTRKVTTALQDNWVITFPQGTTKPFAPGRKGTGFIIRQTKPIVIPVVISGFIGCLRPATQRNARGAESLCPRRAALLPSGDRSGRLHHPGLPAAKSSQDHACLRPGAEKPRPISRVRTT